MLGFNPNELIEKIEAEQKKTGGLKYFDVNKRYSYSIGKISQVINILVNEYEDQDRDYSYKFGKMIFSYVYNNLNESELLRKELRNYIRNINDKDVYLSIFENNTIFRSAKKGIKNYPDDKEFIEQFILKYKIYKKLYNYVEKEDSKLRGELISIDEFALAVTKGIIEKEIGRAHV